MATQIAKTARKNPPKNAGLKPQEEKKKNYYSMPLEARRPRVSKEANLFNENVDKFIALCEDKFYDVPSDYNFLTYMEDAMGSLGYDVTPERIKEYEEEAELHGFGTGLAKLKMYREHFWEVASMDKATATTAIFHLKQPQNGGYKEKQESSIEPIELKVTINGCNDAFK